MLIREYRSAVCGPLLEMQPNNIYSYAIFILRMG